MQANSSNIFANQAGNARQPSISLDALELPEHLTLFGDAAPKTNDTEAISSNDTKEPQVEEEDAVVSDTIVEFTTEDQVKQFRQQHSIFLENVDDVNPVPTFATLIKRYGIVPK